jgi:hypothetical protein
MHPATQPPDPRTHGSASPGRWVRIHRIELSPADRADAIPADTAAVPFEAWINGWARGDAPIGDTIEIRTLTGRLVEGELVELEPGYNHTFGSPPEPLQIAAARAVAAVRGGE